MSQIQSNSSAPSNNELEHFNNTQLQSFLKSHGVKQSGNKDILLKVAKLVAQRPVIIVSSEHTYSPLSDSVIEWKNAATEVAPIPKGFTLETLTNYLREIPCHLSLQGEEELVYSGTVKPVVKGRKMYQSMKLHMAEFGTTGTDLIFCAAFQEVENARNKLLSRARVHVERFNQRIKKFRIISGIVPMSLTPLLSQIVFITCCLANFKEPVAK